MRKQARTDRNQALIVKELRQLGASVQVLSAVGQGCPDLLVGWRGRNYGFEVKDPLQRPSLRKLTPDEQQWHNEWQGQVTVIETVEDALKVMR